MSKALVCFALGDTHKQLLDVALNSFTRFACLHGYELIIGDLDPGTAARPPAWYKIPLMDQALEKHDTVLFIGADCVIVDPTEDPATLLGPDTLQALVKHKTGDGEVPNTDYWIATRGLRPTLREVWELRQWVYFGWWEQAALMQLMGYRVLPKPAVLLEPTELYSRTKFLDCSYNVHIWDANKPAGAPKVLHATMYPDRLAVMKKWEKEALKP